MIIRLLGIALLGIGTILFFAAAASAESASEFLSGLLEETPRMQTALMVVGASFATTVGLVSLCAPRSTR